MISFVDAPGHETLMAVMISRAIMDGALLLEAMRAVHRHKPESTLALQIAGINNIVVVQNKVDLVTRERARVIQ